MSKIATRSPSTCIVVWPCGTANKITDLIQADHLGPDVVLILTNAVYFEARWKSVFPLTQTKDGDFFLTDGSSVNAHLMNNTVAVPYVAGDGFAMLALPYEERLSMLVLLPDDVGGLAALEERLTTTNLTQWLGQLRDHTVDVTIPRFALASAFELVPLLSEMGMPLAFGPGADFSGMVADDRPPPFIGDIIHEALVEVDEHGTEAAAATAVIMQSELGLPRPHATFRANHPFIYLIRDDHTGSILFAGRVVRPEGGAPNE